MRPLKLVLKGFKPFKNRQEIDFSKLNFFVIRGPTGSGKSSILEAMVFALFGEPTEKLNHDDLVNKNSGGFYLDFTFSVGGKVYRIERLRRLGKGGEARFYVNGVRRAIRSDAIKREIQTLLGVNAKQFKKIFFLPQGRYAEFFQSEPAQRRELIVSLLDLDIY
ncbi:MAG TPA: SMC family ATPase, partial [Aquificales bacterium]|nr:SMC family ATPase [Aquificales bacterium]